MILLMFGFPGWAEITICLFVGLLLFGRRLPEVGRSLGRTIVEFKKGIREVKNEVDDAGRLPSASSQPILPPEQAAPSARSADQESTAKQSEAASGQG